MFTAIAFAILSSCSDGEVGDKGTGSSGGSTTPPKKSEINGIEKYTVFTAGDDNINTYRIPSVVVTREGTILAFCEARKKGWQDHVSTAVVLKRSMDNGKTWSNSITVASDGFVGAYADPCPVVDYETGEIFVLMNYWKADATKDATKNTAWLARSKDDGKTWSLADVSSTMIPAGYALQGVGVGSGIQIKGEKFKGRLIIPTRQIDKTTEDITCRALYSDDHGATWQSGASGPSGGEYQITESPLETLYANKRNGSYRRDIGRSYDGGKTWTTFKKDESLFGVYRGCQASVYAKGNTMLFVGPKGGSASTLTDIDDRCNLTIARSIDGGETWSDEQLLYRNAAGYSCIAALPDGRVCVLFESGDTYGFIRTSAARPAGWMRLDLLILPAEVFNEGFWFS